MRRILLLPVMLLSLTLAGCGAGTKVGQLIDIATTSVTNPVNAVDIYRVKNAYAAALQLAVDYRSFCYAKPYAMLMADPAAKPICQNRRSVVRAIQLAKAKASSAISDATTFVANNPTLDAASVITAAWAAVTNFQNAVPKQN